MIYINVAVIPHPRVFPLSSAFISSKVEESLEISPLHYASVEMTRVVQP